MRSSRLTVERDGVLTLPPEVCKAAGLRPGDILAIEAREDYFDLKVYRELSLYVSQSGSHHSLQLFRVP